jgi:hypothetical protein
MNSHPPLPCEARECREPRPRALTKLEQETNEGKSRGEVTGSKEQGRTLARISLVLLSVALTSVVLRTDAKAQTLPGPQLDLAVPFASNPETWSQTQRLVIPRPFAERAKLKARLLNLLRESLYDDAKGIVNIKREKEIKSLASKLRDDKAP